MRNSRWASDVWIDRRCRQSVRHYSIRRRLRRRNGFYWLARRIVRPPRRSSAYRRRKSRSWANDQRHGRRQIEYGKRISENRKRVQVRREAQNNRRLKRTLRNFEKHYLARHREDRRNQCQNSLGRPRHRVRGAHWQIASARKSQSVFRRDFLDRRNGIRLRTDFRRIRGIYFRWRIRL